MQGCNYARVKLTGSRINLVKTKRVRCKEQECTQAQVWEQGSKRKVCCLECVCCRQTIYHVRNRPCCLLLATVLSAGSAAPSPALPLCCQVLDLLGEISMDTRRELEAAVKAEKDKEDAAAEAAAAR